MTSLNRNTYIGRSQDLHLYDVTMQKAEGHRMTDSNGRTYIDFISAASSLPLGYSCKPLVDAYVRQCETLVHTCTVYTYSDIVHEYAKKLTDTSGIPGAKLLFGGFGSDAVDAALKSMQAYSGKERILAFEKAYHGGTYFSLAANGFPKLKQNLHLPTCFTHLPYPDSENCEAVLQEIEAELQKGDVSGLFMETILGDGGVIEPGNGFFPAVLELLHNQNAVLALDEIQTGIGRTGTFWGYEQYGFTPDLFVTGKALGGGYVPLSATIGRPEIIDSLLNAQNAFTLCGHAASCAVGLELLNIFEKEPILQNVQSVGSILREVFSEELQGCPLFSEVRGRGLMLGVALNAQTSIGPAIGRLCLEKGVYIGFYGHMNNVLRIHPHLNIDESTARMGAKAVCEAIRQYADNPAAASTDDATFFTV